MTDRSDVDWRHTYAEKAYAEEVEAMHRLKERVSYVVGLFITPLTGAIYFVYSGFHGDAFLPSSLALFLLPLATAVAVVVLGLGKLFLILRREHRYQKPPSPSQLTSYYDQLSDKATALASLKENLTKAYEAAVDHNATVNRAREKVLVEAQKTIAWAFPFVVVAALYSFHDGLSYVQPPIQVEVVKP